MSQRNEHPKFNSKTSTLIQSVNSLKLAACSLKLFLVVMLTGLMFSALGQTNQSTLSECAKSYFEPNDIDFDVKFENLKKCIVGKQFPSFTATTISGKTYSNADFQDKVVVITSWFAGCQPCVAEIPILNELKKKFESKEFLILSFSTDDVAYIKNFVVKRPISYDIVPNSSELIESKLHTTYGYPTNIILNKKGEIVEYSSGGAVDEAGLDKAKRELIAIIERELIK